VPGSVEGCYEGPAGTQGVGVCAAGERVCLEDANGFGPCRGQVLPGLEDCTTSIDEDCTPSSCPVNLAWAKSAGDFLTYAQSIAADDAGNVVVVGYYQYSSLDLGGGALPLTGASDAFVVKLDAVGNHVWSRSVGGAGSEYASRVTVDAAGAVIVAGETEASPELQLDGQPLPGTGKGFVLKLDAAGGLVWCRRILGGDQELVGMATLAGGDVVVGGTFTGSLEIDGIQGSSFADFHPDPYLVRLDGNTGTLVWAKSWSNPGQQLVESVAVDASGAISMVGRSWASPLTVGGAPLGAGGSLLFVAHYDDGGAHVWSKAASGEAAFPASIETTGTADLWWVGTASEPIDFGGGPIGGSDDTFVVKLSAGGAHVWSRDFTPTAADSRAMALATDPLGNAAVGGYFKNTIDFGAGPLTASNFNTEIVAGFVTKLDPNGNAIWSAMLGSGTAAQVNGVAITPTGHVVAVGYFVEDVDFWGKASFTSNGGLFIAKLGP
jgi:hypothetical protein